MNKRLFFKQYCALCGVDAGADPFCVGCVQALPWRLGQYCPQCAHPIRRDQPCLKCADVPPILDALYAACDFEWPLSALIHAFKYGRRVELASVIAWIMKKGLVVSFLPQPDAIVAVPLAKSRLLERGFNQSRELASDLARHYRVALWDDAVQRIRETAPQASLNREARLLNLSGAFRANSRVEGQNIVLIDDVATTGATLSTLAESLKQQGAARVEGWVLARA